MLHAAARKKDVDIAKILVESGCPVDLQNVILNLVVLVGCVDNKTLWSAYLGYLVSQLKSVGIGCVIPCKHGRLNRLKYASLKTAC